MDLKIKPTFTLIFSSNNRVKWKSKQFACRKHLFPFISIITHFRKYSQCFL